MIEETGRPEIASDVIVSAVDDIVNKDRRVSIREIDSRVEVSGSTVLNILTNGLGNEHSLCTNGSSIIEEGNKGRFISAVLLLGCVSCASFGYPWQIAKDVENGLETDPPIAEIEDVVDSDISDFGAGSCDCKYRRRKLWGGSGCQISKPAPPNFACKCIYMGFWTCKGAVVRCMEENSPYCINPDISYKSCLQGRGNCDGYW